MRLPGRAVALGAVGTLLVSWAFSACLSPTLPLPPPGQPEVAVLSADGKSVRIKGRGAIRAHRSPRSTRSRASWAPALQPRISKAPTMFVSSPWTSRCTQRTSFGSTRVLAQISRRRSTCTFPSASRSAHRPWATPAHPTHPKRQGPPTRARPTPPSRELSALPAVSLWCLPQAPAEGWSASDLTRPARLGKVTIYIADLVPNACEIRPIGSILAPTNDVEMPRRARNP